MTTSFVDAPYIRHDLYMTRLAIASPILPLLAHDCDISHARSCLVAMARRKGEITATTFTCRSCGTVQFGSPAITQQQEQQQQGRATQRFSAEQCLAKAAECQELAG
jgi:hypothetical protein